MEKVMMKCGHASNATKNGKPCCVICIGLTPDAEIVADTPDLTGRIARCSYCKKEAPSSLGLAFFLHLPDREYDDYYCGCCGWD